MADYLTRTLARAINQFLLFFGGILFLALLLCAVASQIRGAGESALGRNYYYIVAPGVVCHETGHAIGCLITGTRIRHFWPFQPHGRELGSVAFLVKDGVWGHVSKFVIASGPVWFGCLVIFLLTKLFAGRSGGLIPTPDASLEHLFSSRRYWFDTVKAAGRMLRNVVHVWHWKSSLGIIYLYLIFCIASEMGLSDEDFECTWLGMICICAGVLVLNIAPAIGIYVSKAAFQACRWLFPIHATMMFVLILDFVFVLLFVWPIRFFSINGAQVPDEDSRHSSWSWIQPPIAAKSREDLHAVFQEIWPFGARTWKVGLVERAACAFTPAATARPRSARAGQAPSASGR